LKGINEEAAAHEQAILYREEKEVEESAFSALSSISVESGVEGVPGHG
jgi:hypothetical protein